MSRIRLSKQLQKLLSVYEQAVKEYGALNSFPSVDRKYVSRRYHRTKRALREYLTELEESAK